MWGGGSGGWGGKIDGEGGDCEAVGRHVGVRVVGRVGKLSSYSMVGVIVLCKKFIVSISESGSRGLLRLRAVELRLAGGSRVFRKLGVLRGGAK